MYCKYCGTKLPDEAKFCMGCGKSVGAEEQTGIGRNRDRDGEKTEIKWQDIGPLILLLCIFPFWSLLQGFVWQYVYNIDRFSKGIAIGEMLPPYLVGRFEIFGVFLFPNWVIWFLGIALILFLVKLGRIRLMQEDGSKCFSYADALVLGLFFSIWPVFCAFSGFMVRQIGTMAYESFLLAMEYIETMMVSPQLIFWCLLLFFMLCRSGGQRSGWKGVLIAGLFFVLFSAAVYLLAGLFIPNMDGADRTDRIFSIETGRIIALHLWLRLSVLCGFVGMYGRRYLKTIGGILLPVLMLLAAYGGDWTLIFGRLGFPAFGLRALLFPVPWMVGGIALLIIRLIAGRRQQSESRLKGC